MQVTFTIPDNQSLALQFLKKFVIAFVLSMMLNILWYSATQNSVYKESLELVQNKDLEASVGPSFVLNSIIPFIMCMYDFNDMRASISYGASVGGMYKLFTSLSVRANAKELLPYTIVGVEVMWGMACYAITAAVLHLMVKKGMTTASSS